MLALARLINSKVKINTSPQSWGNDAIGYTATISGLYGKCNDQTILATMAMRSMGIPAAYEFVPFWGNINNGHSFCSIILPNGQVTRLQSKDDNDERESVIHKAPKIYRRTYAEQRNTILYKNRNKEDIPPLFSDFRILDVTALHKIGQQDIRVAIDSCINSGIVYLSLFSPNGWIPIAYAENKGTETLFTAVGNGTNSNGKISTSGENIGNGILYLPVTYQAGEAIPTAYPIIVSMHGLRTITPDTKTETVVLTRKYPLLERIIRFAEQMEGGVFEGANRPDFADACELYRIEDRPVSHMQRLEISNSQTFQYFRYRKNRGTFSLSELNVYNDKGKFLKGKLIAPEVITDEKELCNINDGDPLTYFEITNGLDLWVGFKFQSQEQIGQIEFCPRNDDNNISPGDKYELFYWDNEWLSLGTKIATDYKIEYDNVPVGALLWLRDVTRGREERPFTYENHNQIWW